jgi:hypothetical protein
MESPDQFNFSLFTPRNLHGRKNRNVILTMLLIWATAVFGFQFLLKGIEKPTPEKALTVFESVWPVNGNADDYKALLNSLVMVKGKITVSPDDQKLLNEAISCATFTIMSDSLKPLVMANIAELKNQKLRLVDAEDQAYLDIRESIRQEEKIISSLTAVYTGFSDGSLEESIFTSSLVDTYPESLSDNAFVRLPDVMKLYLVHNQSVLTDSKFLGFPFHYFYTAVFLLILFIGLCIVYNILIEWRLKKQGVVE